jgi:predicted nucleotidyltransferase component of viral defense system
VQVAAGPAKPVFESVRRCLDPWLGKPKTKTKSNSVQLIYSFETDVPPTRRMRIKVEVNTREHFSELGFRILPFAVENRWFAGEVGILSYALDELLGTKLRALYQRKKGRDLFDLWHASESSGFDAEMVIRCFRAYLAHGGLAISQSEFLANLEEKQRDPDVSG